MPCDVRMSFNLFLIFIDDDARWRNIFLDSLNAAGESLPEKEPR